MKFEIYRSVELRRWCWRWRLVGRNGEIVAHGESYTRKGSCKRAVARIKRAASLADVVDA